MRRRRKLLKPFIWIFFQSLFIILFLTSKQTEARSVNLIPSPILDDVEDVLVQTNLGKIRGLKQVYILSFKKKTQIFTFLKSK